jgi:hypothetical protein
MNGTVCLINPVNILKKGKAYIIDKNFGGDLFDN